MNSLPEASIRELPRVWRRAVTSSVAVMMVGLTAVAALIMPHHIPAQEAQAASAAEVTVHPTEQRLICPGPVVLADPQAGGDDQFSAVGSGTQSSRTAWVNGSHTDVMWMSIDQADQLPLLPTSDAQYYQGAGATDGSELVIRPSDKTEDTTATAMVSSVTTDGDLRGLATASCQPPAVNHWLVGGSTLPGASSQLVLQNPGETPVSVRIRGWGAQGPVPLESGTIQTLAPHSQAVTLLEAIAPDQEATVVQVTATGGLIGAYLQHSILDGLTPGGVDYVMPGAAPTRRQIVEGIVASGEKLDDPHAAQLRLLAPDTAAIVRLIAYGPEGQVRIRGAEEFPLSPGVVTQVPLGGLPAGDYAIAVESSAPIVAGGRLDRPGEPAADRGGTGPQYDLAWIPSLNLSAAPEAPGLAAAMVAVSPEWSASIMMSAVPRGQIDHLDRDTPTGGIQATVAYCDVQGKPLGTKDVKIAAGKTQRIPVPPSLRESTVMVSVELQSQNQADMVWDLIAEGGSTPSGGALPFISVLMPNIPMAVQRQVMVYPSHRVGLSD